jgi:hypothetical protein
MIKKILKILLKAILGLLAGVLALAILVIGVLNVAKFVIYSDYYSAKENVCINPGLSDGFVCQGLAVSDKHGKFIVSGYMKDHSASRLYVTDVDNNSFYVSLAHSNGESFTGHSGGVAVANDLILLASDDSLCIIPIESVLNAKNGDVVTIDEKIKVNNQASFVFANETYVYVGEFHDGTDYVTHHPYGTADGTYYAIISRYSVDDLTKPDKIYSIRDKVQGACFTPDGKVILSTSYGLADSYYYVYNEADARDSGLTLDGAPVYLLDNCIRQIKAPAMSEDLEFYNGKVLTHFESASDKYIFGKLFFANKIVALEY